MRKIGLISCVSKKRIGNYKAEDLYISPLFKYSKFYIKNTCDDFFILSAKYGLLKPDRIINNYELSVNNFSEVQRRIWSDNIIDQFKDFIINFKECKFYILAGKNYYKYLINFFIENKINYEILISTYGIGKRLGYLKEFYILYNKNKDSIL
jgi:hypothetical protein